MAIFHSPRIPTNGLVFAVDPANTKSYSGSGTTWTDLTESRNNATLQNTPTFNATNNQGTFSFDGVNERASFAYTNLPVGSSSGTMMGWAKTTTTVNNGIVISYGTASQDSWRALVRVGSTFYFSGYNSDALGGTIVTNTWYFWTGVYNGTNAILYVDAALIQSVAKSWTTGTIGTPNIGSSPASAEFWNGEISECLIYNRALTAEEILQVYNATRGRFGK
jgi:hypothetical protein